MAQFKQATFTCACGKKKPLTDGVILCGCRRSHTVLDAKVIATVLHPKKRK